MWKNKICGATDIELTEKGHQQARELGKKILEENVHIDEIICSPLIRAEKHCTPYIRSHRDTHARGTKAEGTEFRKV